MTNIKMKNDKKFEGIIRNICSNSALYFEQSESHRI